MERTAATAAATATAAKATSERSLIPDDLVYDILLQLPAQSLIRFKTVSKSWRVIISNPNFILQHQQRRRSVKQRYSYSLLTDDAIEVEAGDVIAQLNLYTRLIKRIPWFNMLIPNTFYSCFKYSCSICTVDGSKLMIWDWDYWDEKEGRALVVQLCMPEFNLDHADQYRLLRLGFGYGSVRDHWDGVVHDRKLVVLVHVLVIENMEYDNRCYVYSFGTRSWRSVQPPPNCSDVGRFRSSTELNGVIYWLVDHKDNYYVLTFNLWTETFGRIELPACNGLCLCRFLTKTGERYLYVVAYSYHRPSDQYITKYLWVMDMCKHKGRYMMQWKMMEYDITIPWNRVVEVGFLWNVGRIVWDEDVENHDEDAGLYAVWEVNDSRYKCRLGMENKTSDHQQIRGSFLV